MLNQAPADGQPIYVVLADDVAAEAVRGGYSVAGLTQTNGGTIDGNGNTLTVTDANGTWDCALYTSGGTIKNLTIEGGFRGIFTAGAKENIIVDNCVIQNVVYTFSSDGSANVDVVFTNSKLYGWTSYTGGYKSVSFTDCTFGEGSGYAYMRPYSATTYTNCNFEEGFFVDTTRIDGIVFENCYLNGVLLTADNIGELIGEENVGNGNYTVK